MITEREETGRRRLEELLSVMTPTNSNLYIFNSLMSVCVFIDSRECVL